MIKLNKKPMIISIVILVTILLIVSIGITFFALKEHRIVSNLFTFGKTHFNGNIYPFFDKTFEEIYGEALNGYKNPVGKHKGMKESKFIEEIQGKSKEDSQVE